MVGRTPTDLIFRTLTSAHVPSTVFVDIASLSLCSCIILLHSYLSAVVTYFQYIRTLFKVKLFFVLKLFVSRIFNGFTYNFNVSQYFTN